MLHPVTEWCAICWVTLQYMYLKLLLLKFSASVPFAFIQVSSLMSNDVCLPYFHHVPLFPKIRERLRLLGGELHAEGLKRLHRHDPRGNCRREVLRSERPQRHILPDLDVPRRPIIQKHKPKYPVLSLIHVYWLSKIICRSTDEGSHLKLIIQALALSERGLLSRRRLHLSPGAADRGPIHHHRRASPMVSNREMIPIRLHRIIWASNNATHVVGMVFRRVEVRIFAYRNWEVIAN